MGWMSQTFIRILAGCANKLNVPNVIRHEHSKTGTRASEIQESLIKVLGGEPKEEWEEFAKNGNRNTKRLVVIRDQKLVHLAGVNLMRKIHTTKGFRENQIGQNRGTVMMFSMIVMGIMTALPSPVVAESPYPQVATRIEVDDPSTMKPEIAPETEVQQLEETVVKDTYLDPFSDEVDAEVIKDPWEPMNAKVFSFNRNVDKYVLKPVATGYAWVVPDPVEQAIGRAIYNIRFVPRTVNDLLQWKWKHAGIEVGRFLVNSTVGVAGFFDVAGDYLDLEAVPEEDFGQTLAKHGVQAGPYLVLPLLPPTTVRDGIGTVGDLLLDPLNYFLPFIPQASLRATGYVWRGAGSLCAKTSQSDSGINSVTL